MAKNIWANILEEGEEIKWEFSIGKKYRLIQALRITIPGFLLILGAVFGTLFYPFFIFLTIPGFFLMLIGWFDYWYLRRANNFAFTNLRVLCKRGWLGTMFTTAKYKQITHVEVEQPFWDRVITNTGEFRIDTAGISGTEIVFSHIENPYFVRGKMEELRG